MIGAANPGTLSSLYAGLTAVFEDTAKAHQGAILESIDEQEEYTATTGECDLSWSLDDAIEEWRKGTIEEIRQPQYGQVKEQVRATVYDFFRFNLAQNPQRLIEWLGSVLGCPLAFLTPDYVSTFDWTDYPYVVPGGSCPLLACKYDPVRQNPTYIVNGGQQKLDHDWLIQAITEFKRRVDLAIDRIPEIPEPKVVNPLTPSTMESHEDSDDTTAVSRVKPTSRRLRRFEVPLLKGEVSGKRLQVNRKSVVIRIFKELAFLKRECRDKELSQQLISQYPELVLCEYWNAVKSLLDGKPIPIEQTLKKKHQFAIPAAILRSKDDDYSPESLERLCYSRSIPTTATSSD